MWMVSLLRRARESEKKVVKKKDDAYVRERICGICLYLPVFFRRGRCTAIPVLCRPDAVLGSALTRLRLPTQGFRRFLLVGKRGKEILHQSQPDNS